MNFKINKKKVFTFIGIIIVEIIFSILLSSFTLCGVVPEGFVCKQSYSWLIWFTACNYCASIDTVISYYLNLLIMPVISYIFISLGEKK